MKRSLAPLIIILLISGCNILPPDVAGVLNRAIDAFDRQPSAWRTVLQDTIQQLKQSSEEVAQKVERLYQDGVAFTGVEARCETDFFFQRIRSVLVNIRDTYRGLNPPPPAAWICHFNPDHIRLDPTGPGRWKVQDADTLVNVLGFSFTYSGLPVVELRDSNGKPVRTSAVKPVYQTAYNILLNFQVEDFSGVGPGSAFYLKWQDASDPNGLPIMLNPSAPPPVTLTSALAFFHTYDDDKNDDTVLIITLYGSRGEVVAQLGGITGEFPDSNSDRGPFSLPIQNPRNSKDQIMTGTAGLEIRPKNSDTWKFNYRLALNFSDGSHAECNFKGKQLKESSRFGLYPLVGAC